jgi:TP901 family phage tail tape measure protein
MAGNLIGQVLLGLGLDTDALKKQIPSIEDMFKGLGKKIIAGASLASVGLAIKASIDAFSGLQDKMALIDTLGASDDRGIAGLKNQLIELSKQLPISSSELAEAAYQGLSAGIAFDKVGAAAKIAGMGARAGVSDTKTAMDALTTVMNVWGEEVGDAEAVMDIFLTTQNLGKTTMGELAASIGGVAATAAGMGVSFREVSAATATLTLAGVNTAASMTGLKAVLSNIAKPSQDASAMAKELGVDFSVAALQSQGFAGWTNTLKEKLEEYTLKGGNATDANTKLWGSVEALNVMLNLTSTEGGIKFNDFLGKMNDSAGTTQEMFGKVNDTFSSQWTILKNQLFPVLESLGSAFVTVLIPAMQLAGPIIKALAEYFVTYVGQMVDSAKAIGTAFGAVGDAWSWITGTAGLEEQAAAYLEAEKLRKAAADKAVEDAKAAEKAILEAKNAKWEETKKYFQDLQAKMTADEKAEIEARQKAEEARVKAEKDLFGGLYDWIKTNKIDWTKLDEDDLDKLLKDIDSKRVELEKSLALKPSIATQNAIKQLDDFELTVKAQATIANADLKMKPDIDPSNLDNVQPVLEEKILVPMKDVRDQVELDINDGFNIFKMRLTESLDEVAVAGRGAIEDEFVSLFQGNGFSFSNVLKTLENSLFSQLAGMAADAVVGKDGKGGIMGTITGALGITGPVGMAIAGGITALWSIFGSKPKEENLFNKIGTEIRTAFSDAMTGFWNDFRDDAAEALSDVGSDKSELIKDSFKGLFDSIMDGLGDSFDSEKFATAIRNGASNWLEALLVEEYLAGQMDWTQLSSEVQTMISTFFQNYQLGIQNQITSFTDGWKLQLQQMQSAGLITQEQYDNAMVLIGQYAQSVQDQILPYFEEFQTNMKLDPDNADYYFQQLQTKLAWAFELMGNEFGSYQDLVDALAGKLADTAVQTQSYSQELIDLYIQKVKNGLLTLEQVAGQVGPEFAALIAKAMEEAAKAPETQELGEGMGNKIGHDVAEGLSDGVADGLDERDPLIPIRQVIEAGTDAWQLNLLNAYQSGKTLSAQGLENIKTILQGLLDSGAVTVSDLVAMYGAGVAEMLGYTVEKAKNATEDIVSDVGDIIDATQDAIDQIGNNVPKGSNQPGLDTGPGTASTEDQITAVKDVIAAIENEYNGYYDAIDRRIDYQQSLIEAKIQTELDGVNEVLAAMTERYEREIDYLANNNTESQNSLEGMIDLYSELGDIAAGDQEAMDAFNAEQQRQIDELNTAKAEEIALLDAKISKLREEGYTQEQIAQYEAEKMRYINETIVKMEQEGASAQEINEFRNTELSALNDKIVLMSSNIVSEEQLARYRESELHDIETAYAQKQAIIEQAEYQAKLSEEALEKIRAYNQEELENLVSVNAANASIVAYKIQQSDLSADQQAKYQAQLEAAISISDAQERQKALMELANQLSAAGVEINLQDYQLIQMKTDLTAEEVKAMAEKAELAKEAIKDMNEDLAIQRQRLQDAGLPTLEIEKQMAILKQEQLAKIAEQLGINMDQLSVMDSQLIKTEEQKKANLELAQQQISALNQELSQMEANGASQEDINAARIAALQAISGNLGIEQSTLTGLLNQQNALSSAEQQKLAYQQAQLDALNGVKSATESMRDVMQGLQTTISNLAIALQGIANTNIDQPARDLDSAIQGAGYDANSLRDTLGSINDMVITPNFNIPKEALETLDVAMPSFASGIDFVPYSEIVAKLHYGERVLTADENQRYTNYQAPVYVNISGNNISSDLDIMDIADRVSEQIGKTIKAGVLV